MENEKPLTLIQKALEENQEKFSSLDNEEAKLGKELAKLSEKLEAPEVIQAKINVLGRQAEEALANGKPQRAEELKSEIIKVRGGHDATIAQIKAVNEKIDLIRSERRRFVDGLLKEAHPNIKERFAFMLEAVVAWVELEASECSQIASENGITLPGSFLNELRIFGEGSRGGSRDWRPLRAALDRWLP